MAIYDIFEHFEKCVGQDSNGALHVQQSHHYSELALGEKISEGDPESKSRLFSSIASRLFFFMLLVADLGWTIYSTALFFISLMLNTLTGWRVKALKNFHKRRYLNLKRSFVCALSLVVTLLSPALGTMFACTYFLMYDKKGVEEVVPSVLQDQFREFFT